LFILPSPAWVARFHLRQVGRNATRLPPPPPLLAPPRRRRAPTSALQRCRARRHAKERPERYAKDARRADARRDAAALAMLRWRGCSSYWR